MGRISRLLRSHYRARGKRLAFPRPAGTGFSLYISSRTRKQILASNAGFRDSAEAQFQTALLLQGRGGRQC